MNESIGISYTNEKVHCFSQKVLVHQNNSLYLKVRKQTIETNY